jgi:hypothetical protein
MAGHKKGRPKSPKLPCVLRVLESSALLVLVRILPDEIADAGEEGDHQTDSADSGKYYDIDKHGCLLREACVGMASR